MTKNDVLFLNAWFEQFTNCFTSEDPEVAANIRYKREHSFRVRDYMLMIGRDLQLPKNQMILAEVIGLLHDVGRFEQYSKYHTFKDHLSEDHAMLGLLTLEREKILNDRTNESEKEIISSAIRNHNQRVIEENLSDVTLMFCRLIRDADKLDIFEQIISFYENPSKTPYLAVETNSEDTRYSTNIIESILNGKQISYTTVKNPLDIKLIRLSWLLDLSFPISLKIAQSKQYFERFKVFIPTTEDTRQVFNYIEQRVFQKLSVLSEKVKP
ncbi:HD-GYP domain-containing protein [Desulfosporosinus acidiphilus SJ4]|uniref:HD-GYP domain-containing protein n=1 Tax=Desulfosporosinus acidiphilus (strain DSM 22704 / JCM 16185 / SJ4) TaxID=646529 RepID=I4D2W8_DESAJ|nr:HD domain-containing protein [Desulfosporosinus acidiphilus]AFM40142.1 HD-GYP domain-containing protein [Desulfosporosinus acidiphilus SJ4]